MPSTALHDFLRSGNWKKALKHLTLHPHETAVQDDCNQMLPLHVALHNGAPACVSLALLEAGDTLVAVWQPVVVQGLTKSAAQPEAERLNGQRAFVRKFLPQTQRYVVELARPNDMELALPALPPPRQLELKQRSQLAAMAKQRGLSSSGSREVLVARLIAKHGERVRLARENLHAARREMCRVKDLWGRTPLHWALVKGAAPAVTLAVLAAHRPACRETDEWDSMPLHLALAHSAPPEVTLAVLQEHIGAACKPDRRSSLKLLPLDYAITQQATEEVLRAVLAANPAARVARGISDSRSAASWQPDTVSSKKPHGARSRANSSSTRRRTRERRVRTVRRQTKRQLVPLHHPGGSDEASSSIAQMNTAPKSTVATATATGSMLADEHTDGHSRARNLHCNVSSVFSEPSDASEVGKLGALGEGDRRVEERT